MSHCTDHVHNIKPCCREVLKSIFLFKLYFGTYYNFKRRARVFKNYDVLATAPRRSVPKVTGSDPGGTGETVCFVGRMWTSLMWIRWPQPLFFGLIILNQKYLINLKTLLQKSVFAVYYLLAVLSALDLRVCGTWAESGSQACNMQVFLLSHVNMVYKL